MQIPASELKEIIHQFVISLQGRYSNFLSDFALERYLIRNINHELARNAKYPLVTASIYHIGAELFEGLLENDCGAGGNGHHVAQELATMFVKFDNEEEKEV